MPIFTKESGIYCFENIINNKKYVGKATNLHERINKHEWMLKKEICPLEENIYLWNSIHKYGRNNFKIYIVEICSQDDINEKEIYYINNLKSHWTENGYNMTWGGEGISGYKWTDEQKKNLPNRKGQNNSQYGKDFCGIQNPAFGKKNKNPTSKYLGVSLKITKKANGKEYRYWVAAVQINKRLIHLGQSKLEDVAAKIYDKYIIENNLPNPLNFPNEYNK